MTPGTDRAGAAGSGAGAQAAEANGAAPADEASGQAVGRAPLVGVLALQGDVAEHLAALDEVGARTRVVRRPADLEGLDGLVIPGGESTTLSMLLDSSGLRPALEPLLAGGLPTFGTCAGLVLLADKVLDGRADQRSFGVIDCAVRRNAYGRQLQSFEAELDARCLGTSAAGDSPGDAPEANPKALPAVFIRAPAIEATGPEVEPLAWLDGPPPEGGSDPVVVRQGSVLVTAFHPELTSDRRLHRLFVEMVRRAGAPR